MPSHVVLRAGELLAAGVQAGVMFAAVLASMSRPAARELSVDVHREVVAPAAGLATAAGTNGAPRVPGGLDPARRSGCGGSEGR